LPKNLSLLGFVLCHQWLYVRFALRATGNLQFTPLPKNLSLLGFVLCPPAPPAPASGLICAPCNERITVYTPAKKPVPAGFYAFARQPASGLICYSLRATGNLQFTRLPKNLSLLGFVLFVGEKIVEPVIAELVEASKRS